MKLAKRMMDIFHGRAIDRTARQRRRDVQYYDNYNMLGTILGGYCGMFNKGNRKG